MRKFSEDMIEQPYVLQQVASYYSIEEGRELLRSSKTLADRYAGRVVFTGMGSSYAASRLAGNYLWSLGIPAIYVEASELLHYGMKTILDQSLLVLISQSGESVEVKEILQQLAPSVEVIGITNDPASTLARRSSLVFPLFAGEESTTSSKTYTATLAVTLLLCGSIAGLSPDLTTASIQVASNKFSELDTNLASIDWGQVTEWVQAANAVYLIGRGPAVASALQGALTFKELVKVPAECMEAAQFRHGPLETVTDETLIFVFASQGLTSELAHSFVEELVKCGAKVIVIEEGNARIAHDAGYVRSPGGQVKLDEYFSTLVDIYPVQMAANSLAERLGISGFKWITKVTHKE